MTIAAARPTARRVRGGARVPLSLRPLRRALWAAAALAALAGLALLAPAPAGAQTSVSVSNIAQTTDNRFQVRDTAVLATAFTTGGSRADRFRLGTVVLDVHSNPGTATQLDVSIHAAGAGSNSSNPGSKIGNSLTGTIDNTAGQKTFTASGIVLNGATTYFVRVKSAATLARDIDVTTSDTQTGTAGWSIADAGRRSVDSGATWGAIAGSAVLKMTVNATVVPPGLSANNVTQTAATLTLVRHTGAWWYKGNQAGAQCTRVAAGTSMVNLTGLTANTAYTYKAYSNRGCTAELTDSSTDVHFRTLAAGATPCSVTDLGVCNLSQGNTTQASISTTDHFATAFTTGGTSADRFTLNNVVIFATSDADTGALDVSIHNASGSNPGTKVGSSLTGTTTAGLSTFTASGITLNGATTYFVSLRTTSSIRHVGITSSDAQTGSPGWSIANDARASNDSGTTWGTGGHRSLRFTVNATAAPELSVANITQTGAQLTIANHRAAWWYKGDQTGAQCTRVAAGTSMVNLTGLTANTPYIYKAYSDSSCTAELTSDATDVHFRTLAAGATPCSVTDLGVCNLSQGNTSQASISTTDHFATAFTTGGTSADRFTLNNVVIFATSDADTGALDVSIHNASGSNPGTKVGSSLTGTTTAGLSTFTASGITLNGATTYFVSLRTTSSIRHVGITSSDAQTGSPGWSIANDARASNDSGTTWGTGGHRSLRFTVNATAAPLGLSAGSVTRNTAALTIANHTAAWWYTSNRQTASGQCVAVAAGTATATVATLMSNTRYIFKAYSDSSCRNELTTDATDAVFTTPAAACTVSGAGVCNLSQAGADGLGASSAAALATAFTTGGTSADRFTLDSVVLEASTRGSAQLDVSIHAAGTGSSAANPGTKIGSSLTGTIGSTGGLTTWTASGITLNGATTYFVRAGTASGARVMATTASDAQTGSSGWSIADTGRVGVTGGWGAMRGGRSLRLTVNATAVAALRADNIAPTGARLTLTGHTGAWWHKGNQNGAQCTRVAAGMSTANLTGLTASTAYTYKAYSDSSCTNELTAAGTDAEFTTLPAGTTPCIVTDLGVCNLTQGTFSGWGVTDTTWIANAFTTGGTGTARYTLNTVILDVGSGTAGLVMSIHAAGTGSNSANPGTKVGSDLTGTVDNTAGTKTFTASDVTLNGNTTYFMVVRGASATVRSLNATKGDAETGTTGWSIADTGRNSHNSGGSWTTTGAGLAFKFTVNAGAPTPPTFGITSVLNSVGYGSIVRNAPGGSAVWSESFTFASGAELLGGIAPGTVTCATGTAEIGWYKSDALTTRLGAYSAVGGGSYTMTHTPTAADGEYRALAYCKRGTTYSTPVNLMRGGAVTLTAADTTAPSFGSATVNGTSLVITMNETLAAASSLANSAFTVKKNGGSSGETLSGSPSISGATVTLTLGTAAVPTDSFTVSYTKPGTCTTNCLEDAAGNETASFTDQTVTNNTDTTAPGFSSAAVNGTSLVITMDEALAAAASLANGAFTVKKNGGSSGETLGGSPSISGATVTLTLGTAAVSTDRFTVSYAKPGTCTANCLEDAAGNETASFTDQAVTNNTAAPTPPPSPTGAVWSATLTVDLESDVEQIFGCGTFPSLITRCSSALTDDDFTYGGTSYDVTDIRANGSGNTNPAISLSITLDKAWPSAIRSRGTLTLGPASFSFSNATFLNSNKIARWLNPAGLTWSDGSSVPVSLSVSTAPVDTKHPRLVSVAPPDDATGIATNADLVLTFSEPVKKGTGTILIDAAGNPDDVFIPVASNEVTVSGNRVTINPGSNLAASKAYNVQIPAGAITDLTGNVYRGIADRTSWNFTTGTGADSAAPTVSTLSPGDGDTGVARNANLVITFNEPVRVGSGNIVVNAATGDDLTISVTDDQVTVSGSTVTINPATDLIASRGYSVQIANGAIEDLAGNDYAGITNTTDWNFTSHSGAAPPAAPTLTAAPRDRWVWLTWEPNALSVPATEWQYQWRAQASGNCSTTESDYSAWATAPGGASKRTFAMNRGLSNGTRYCFRVRGVHRSGATTVNGAASDPKAATPSATANTLPTVRFSNSFHQVAGGGEVTLTVTLSQALAGDVTLPLRAAVAAVVVDGRAVHSRGGAEAEDYTLPPSVTIAAGATTADFTVNTHRDDDDDVEHLYVLFDGHGFPSTVKPRRTWRADGQMLGTWAGIRITEPDMEEEDIANALGDGGGGPVTVTLAAGPDWTSEGRVTEGGTAVIRATRTGPAAGALSIPVRINPLATEAGDYDARDGYTIEFKPGESVAELEIPTYRDADRDDERFNVWMVRYALPEGVAPGDPHHVYVTIAEPEPVTVTLAAGPDWTSEGSVAEGGTAVIRATRTGSAKGALGIPVRVNPRTESHHAEAGDYDAKDGYTIDFKPGESVAELEIRTYADADADDERLNVWMVRWALPPEVLPGDPHHVYVTIAESALSVADATAAEPGEGTAGSLDFTVTLAPAAAVPVTVDYATRDGTAVAGSDYTAASGRLSFAVGETRKTVSVPVLADAHDDGGETLTLVLSNAQGAWLSDSEATGTVTNEGPIPMAWTARFGRTVADQVIGAVEARMRAGRAPGAEVSLAGERIGLGPLFGAGDDEAEAEAARERAEARQEKEAQREALRLAEWLKGGADPGSRLGGRDMSGPGQAGGADRPGFGAGAGAASRDRSMAGRELLLGSSFSLTAGTADGGSAAFWGRGSVTGFDGREGETSVDGEVTTALLGADWSPGSGPGQAGAGRVTAGLILGHSMGEGGYRGASGGGTVSSTLTGLYPWGRYALSERVTLWGVAGWGEGTLALTPENAEGTKQSVLRADLELMLGAAGLRGMLLDGGADGFTLTAKADAMAVRTSSGRGRGASGILAASEATVTRLRLGLEAGRPIMLDPAGATLTPSLEVGVRQDGGDAETGFGVDLGGGLAFSDPALGLEAEIRGRGLLSHASKGFRERGLSGSLSWRQKRDSDRGATLSLTQTVGGAASGGADALLGRTTLQGLAANDNGDDLRARRLEVRFGYGLAAFSDRFTLTPEAGAGFSGEGGRDYRLGLRLAPAGDAAALELSFEALRREAANDGGSGAEHEVGVRLQARW